MAVRTTALLQDHVKWDLTAYHYKHIAIFPITIRGSLLLASLPPYDNGPRTTNIWRLVSENTH